MATWHILSEINRSSNHLTIEEIIKILLKNRGLIHQPEISEFLEPRLDKVNAKTLGLDMKELQKAYLRIKKAKEKKEKVIVYTDYDVDGISSGAIVWETLYNLGINALPYVPHREKEGYGLSYIGIDNIKKDYQAKLIITVDHGISAIEKIKYAQKLGIDIIVLDHHDLPKILPQVESLIHSTRVCATTIAWFFSNFLQEKFADKSVTNLNMEDNLDLVCLSTIADLIPLRNINRTLAIFGLRKFPTSKRIGLKTLITQSGLNIEEINTYSLGHIIAPRINALGRMSHAIDALRLLCTKDSERAISLSAVLNQANKDRQVVTEEAFSIALSQAKSELAIGDPPRKRIIFVAHESFGLGVIGLLAARLVEKFNLPAIVVSQKKEFSKASARSVNGVNIVELLRKAESLLVDIGGHPMAAGFTVETGKIEKLKNKLLNLSLEERLYETKEKKIDIDLELQLSDLSLSLYEAIQKLSPFGAGNKEPLFLSKNMKVNGVKLIGKNKNHLKLFLQHASGKLSFMEAVGFNLGYLYNQLSFDQHIDIVYELSLNNWDNKSTLQLILKDVKLLK